MYVIPLLGYDDNFIADVALVTAKEFEEWLSNEIMPKVFIPTEFLKQYLDAKILQIDIEIALGLDDKKTIETLYPSHLSMERIIILLKDLKLDYNDFILEYTKYLSAQFNNIAYD